MKVNHFEQNKFLITSTLTGLLSGMVLFVYLEFAGQKTLWWAVPLSLACIYFLIVKFITLPFFRKD